MEAEGELSTFNEEMSCEELSDWLQQQGIPLKFCEVFGGA